jgi:hypothetical protein
MRRVREQNQWIEQRIAEPVYYFTRRLLRSNQHQSRSETSDTKFDIPFAASLASSIYRDKIPHRMFHGNGCNFNTLPGRILSNAVE